MPELLDCEKTEIINTDIINNFTKDDWNKYEPITNINEIIPFIQNIFGPDLDCYLSVVVYINDRGGFSKFLINIHITDMDLKYIPLIIDVNYRMIFDRDICNICQIRNKGYSISNRTEKMYIQNKNIQNILKKLNTEIKQSVKDYFKANIISN
jgi:hypothetical protein